MRTYCQRHAVLGVANWSLLARCDDTTRHAANTFKRGFLYLLVFNIHVPCRYGIAASIIHNSKYLLFWSFLPKSVALEIYGCDIFIFTQLASPNRFHHFIDSVIVRIPADEF